MKWKLVKKSSWENGRRFYKVFENNNKQTLIIKWDLNGSFVSMNFYEETITNKGFGFCLELDHIVLRFFDRFGNTINKTMISKLGAFLSFLEKNWNL